MAERVTKSVAGTDYRGKSVRVERLEGTDPRGSKPGKPRKTGKPGKSSKSYPKGSRNSGDKKKVKRK